MKDKVKEVEEEIEKTKKLLEQKKEIFELSGKLIALLTEFNGAEKTSVVFVILMGLMNTIRDATLPSFLKDAANISYQSLLKEEKLKVN